MNGMKRFLAFFLFLAVLAAIFAGCGQVAPSDEPDRPESPTVPVDTESTGSESESQDVKPEKTYNDDPAKVVFGLEKDTDDRTTHAYVADEAVFQRLTISGRDCILFKHSRMDENQNLLRLGLDSETAKVFENGILNLVFNLYITEKLTIEVDYLDTSGEQCKKTVEFTGTRAWSYATVQMENVAFTKGIEGYDFFITFKGPEIIRVSKVAFMLGDKMYSNKPALIQSDRITDELLVADCDVKYYGAIGDGITDDTAAFKAAIAQVTNQKGGTVFVPEGRYLLTSSLNLPNGVSLVGELTKGTTDGTVLLIGHGANSTNNADCAISVGTQSAVKNICFYYPEQTMADGKAIPFPPTILQKAVESITLANLYFVNAYLAIDCATDHENLSLQHIYDIYGCTLSQLYWNDSSYDIGRIENVFVGPEYWLSSGFPAPDASFLKAYCRANSVGLHLQRIDWTYISDIHISDYYMGVLADQSQYGASNGHLYNLDFNNVYYGLCGKYFWWFLLTNCKIKVSSDEGATPIYIGKDNTGNVSCSYCELSGGKNAVVNKGSGSITFGNCVLDGKEKALVTNSTYSMVNTSTGNDKTDYANQTVQMSAVDFSAIGYAPKYATKPASKEFIDLTGELAKLKSNANASEVIQKALDSLKGKGGTVYVPGGTYTLTTPLNVWAGIELRGASEAATSQVSPTKFVTDYGRNDENGTALFTLYEGAGLRGFRVTYPTVVSEISAETPVYTPYAYTVRGNGARIYIINVSLHSSYNGVDFSEHRCDDHYVQYLWGCPINVGIKVGAGSKGGIIRDVHYTPNCFGGNWNQVFSYIMSHSRCFWTMDCEDEVLYHNFTYAGWRGIELGDGTENCVVICHGTDCGNYAAYVEGECTATLIDSQLVNLPGGTPDFRAYIYTAPNFTGDVSFINTGMWGATVKTVYLEGTGHVLFYQGIISNSGSTTFNVVRGEAEIYGMYSSTGTLSADVRAYDGCYDCIAIGNLFASGGKYTGAVTQQGNKKA